MVSVLRAVRLSEGSKRVGRRAASFAAWSRRRVVKALGEVVRVRGRAARAATRSL